MPSHPDAKILVTSASPRGWHRLQQAAECLQKYAWGYENPDGPAAKKPMSTVPALAKGSLMHLALAHRYARMRETQNGGDPDTWCEPAEAVELIAKTEGATAFIKPVMDTYNLYARCYPHEIDEIKILEVEELHQITVGGRFLVTGRVDLVYEDLAGLVWACDHKTTAWLRPEHKQYYSVSGQLLGYSHMVRETYGDRFAGMAVNLLQVGEGSKGSFERVPLARAPKLEAKWAQTVIDIEESIERMKASGREQADWPKAMNELTCYSRYGPCDHIDRCRWGKDASTAGSWTWNSGKGTDV